jgi:protein required for attachment to host cells
VKECLDSQVQEKIIETITKDYVTLPVKDVREKVNSVILV